ncbi:hypothetical protein JYU34_020112, partial [Plutella xylostella]
MCGVSRGGGPQGASEEIQRLPVQDMPDEPLLRSEPVLEHGAPVGQQPRRHQPAQEIASCGRNREEAERAGDAQAARQRREVRQRGAAAARQVQQVPHGEQAAASPAREERDARVSGRQRQRGLLVLCHAVLQAALQ